MKPKHLTTVLLVLAFVAILGPIVVYLFIFGGNISTDHSRWAEFGSAIGGIYSPLVALLTLVVLLKQVQLQAQTSTREADYAFVQSAKEEIEFYSARITEALQIEVLPRGTVREFLAEHFYSDDLAALDSLRLRQLAANLHRIHAPIFDIWCAVYPILSGLQEGKAQTYQLALGTSIQRLVTLLGLETCITLDNFHRTLCEGRLPVNYKFSPLLSSDDFLA